MVNIISYNVNGLRDFKKRKKIYDHLKTIHQADILLLQETHCTQQDEALWRSQWGGQTINSYGESNARGVALMFGRNCNCSILNSYSDPQGRFVISEVILEDKQLVICGIYAPNSDQPQFFQTVLNEIDKFQNPNVVLAGDFNLVFDICLDRRGTSEYNHPKSAQLLSNYMDQMEMSDIWRLRNPGICRYTCHKRNSQFFSRIDNILISNALVQYVKEIDIKPSYNSDHAIIKMNCNFTDMPRGKGFWKLNTTLLDDQEHNSLIAPAVDSTLTKYQNENPALQWEMIKMQIVSESMSYSRKKAAQRNANMKHLQEEISWWTSRLEIDPLGEQIEIEQILTKLQSDYDQIMEFKFRGACFRSKCLWYEKGERSSKYFFNLEKSKYNAKTVKQIFDSQGNLEENPSKILDIQAAFFSRLYTRDEEVNFTLQNNSGNYILPADAKDLEKEISVQELTTALSGLNTDKTPGADGLPPEIYKHFWEILSSPLHRALNFACSTGLMHISARRGVISLIPKKDKDNRFVENWRPIMLLNTDYKILAKALVNRMQNSLEKIISPHQTGFMPGRKISHNIRKMLDIIEYTQHTNQPGCILSIDFYKCFDSLSHQSILGALKYFGFGERFTQYVGLLLKEVKICVQNNGKISHWFDLQRGSPQGSNASTAIFLICGQILSDLLTANQQIEGIKVGNNTELLIQFADDTNLFLQCKQSVFDEVMQTLKIVYHQIGLKINYDKTTVYRIGSLRDSNASLYTEAAIAWTDDPIKVLGITISEENMLSSLNYKGISKKLQILQIFGEIAN